MTDDIDKREVQDEAQAAEPTTEALETAGETALMPAAGAEEAAQADKDQPQEQESDGQDPRPADRRRRRLVACAAALAIGTIVAGGAWYATTARRGAEPVATEQAVTPNESKETTPREADPQRKAVTAAIDAEAATEIVNDMGLPKTSRVKVEADDRRVVVTEEVDLVDKLVAERAYDRAYEMAGLVEEGQAESVTWVLDNGKGATAAVTVRVEDGRDEAAAPTDVAGKLASAEGYALSQGAYDPVKDKVAEPSAGEVPVSTTGNQLVEVAMKADEKKADATSSSRTPDADDGSGEQQQSAGSRTPSSSGTSMTRDTSSGGSSSSSSSGTSSGGSSSSSSAPAEPARRWVEEQGHWEDTYESQEVKVGTRWVVDQEAWDEDVYETRTYWAFSDGYTTESEEDGRNHMYQKRIEGDPVTGGVVTEQVYTGTVHHDEVGHYEDVYETQQVKTGSTWVVDVPGHWE